MIVAYSGHSYILTISIPPQPRPYIKIIKSQTHWTTELQDAENQSIVACHYPTILIRKGHVMSMIDLVEKSSRVSTIYI